MASGVLVLIVRILLAAMFLSSGWSALSDIDGTAGYFEGLGLGPPTLLAWGVGIFELLAGVLVVAGFQTRAVAVVLALFTLAASYLGHYGQGGDDAAAVFMHNQMLLKDLAAAGGLILLALHGAGPVSVDGWRS
jgi:putative oxidoreductase